MWIALFVLLQFFVCIHGQCQTRDLEAAARVRRSCVQPCTIPGDPCGDGGVCTCDHECGYSCINPARTCQSPPVLPHTSSFRVYRKLSNRSLAPVTSRPYRYDHVVEYECEAGYQRVPPFEPHFCHNEGGWTGRTICARTCGPYSFLGVWRNRMTCAATCVVDSDCPGRESCLCDGHCGRACVNADIDCGAPPPAMNAIIEITGSGFYSVARYTCNEGYYRDSGSSTRKCTGGGTWDGQLVSCQRVTCGNPGPSIGATRGHIVNGQSTSYYVGHQITLACAPHHRLLGYSVRTCISNGRWSGMDTVCDLIDGQNRCHHPGVPINGNILPNHGFAVGNTVEFTCDQGYSMVGERQQECLYFLQWSGNGAPQCVDPRFWDNSGDVLDRLSLSTEDIQATGLFQNIGHSFGSRSPSPPEAFFVIDASDDVRDDALNDSISFAKDWVSRIGQQGRIKCAVIVFASNTDTLLDLAVRPSSIVDETLERIQVDRINLIREIGSQRNTHKALVILNNTLSASFLQANGMKIQRHVFLFINGQHRMGEPPRAAMESIKESYQTDLEEVYVISFGDGLSSSSAFNELQTLSSFYGRFLRNPRLSSLNSQQNNETYVDCGKAGDVGSVKQQARVGRVVGGDKASERAWPWQVAVTLNLPFLYALQTYQPISGGGSLISNEWVLTAAHLFDGRITKPNFQPGSILLTFGLHQRPSNRNYILPGHVQVYQAAQVIVHDNYTAGRFDNDIALIKIGSQLQQSGDGWVETGQRGWLNYTSRIRLVCLPCMDNGCVGSYLSKEGVALLNGDETEEERCEIEGNWLSQHEDREENNILAVVTGFGETRSLTPFMQASGSSDYLNQGLIRLRNNARCRQARDIMVTEGLPSAIKFTERMLCGIGGSQTSIIDACKGDSGGPLVREVRDDETGESCWVLMGIVSWGFGCAHTYMLNGSTELYPGYYTNVLTFTRWIKTHIIGAVPSWSEWSPWSSCDVTCENGSQSRSRMCMNGDSCIGDTMQQNDCFVDITCPCTCPESETCVDRYPPYCNVPQSYCIPGYWYVTNCRKTCRVCTPCVCGGWSNWAPVGGCSHTCGGGEKIERRMCRGGSCAGSNSRVVACNLGLCPVWGEWEQVGGCSVTCGDGTVEERRRCINGPGCIGIDRRTSSCNIRLCPVWGEWEEISECSVTCGDGTVEERRRCINGPGCIGIDRRTSSCNIRLCPGWSNWAPVGGCSHTCGGGENIERRMCRGGSCAGSNSRVVACNLDLCPVWGEWEQVGGCSVTCGDGTVEERRRCINGPGCIGIDRRTSSCNIRLCPVWGEWEQIGGCSVTCGDGTVEERRRCMNGPGCVGINRRTSSCNIRLCPVWGEWEQIGGCSVTCGDGTVEERRRCINGPGCIGIDRRTSSCNIRLCPVWGEWEEMGECSVTCGDGTMEERRRCMNGPGCVGINRRTSSCNIRLCPVWGEWEQIGGCSVTCGDGTVEERRRCINGPGCIGIDRRTSSCNIRLCPDDPDLNIMLIFDSTDHLDDCVNSGLGNVITQGTAGFDATTFPEFFRQLDLAREFEAAWVTIDTPATGDSSIAYHAHTGECNVATAANQSPLTTFNELATDRETALNDMVLTCEHGNPAGVLLCVDNYHLVTALGYRNTLPTIYILMFADITNVNTLLVRIWKFLINDPAYFLTGRVFTLSTQQTPTMTNIDFLTDFAANAGNTPGAYLGSIFQTGEDLAAALRSHVP